MDKGISENRTIEEVRNLDTRKIILANEFFKWEEHIVWDFREKCQEAIKKRREPFLVCNTCGQMVQISGGKGIKGKIKHFKHLKDSKDCPIKTDTRLSKDLILRGKFNGQKEGALHIETKNSIYKFLCLNKENKGEISFAKQEMVNKSNRDYLKWKKPDITSIFNNQNLVFEIQLATTFLDVICERQYFYKENSTFIIWVFKNFDIESDKQKFTQKDIFYSNNRNAFILDDEAIRLSRVNNDLTLLCQYQKPTINQESIIYEWVSKYVNLSDLIFDEASYKVYYFDVTKAENEVQLEIDKKNLERKENERILKEKDEKLRQFEMEEEYDFLEYSTKGNPYEYMTERELLLERENTKFKEENSEFYNRLNSEFILTPLQGIFHTKKEDFVNKMENLIQSGYSLSKSDKTYLKNEFNIGIGNSISNRESVLYYISVAILLSKLKPKEIIQFRHIERISMCILSIKYKRIIGYDYAYLRQVVNLYFNPKNERKYKYSEVIRKAIEKFYGVNEYLLNEDTKGTYKAKLKDYFHHKPIQETQYNTILNKIFIGLDLEISSNKLNQ